MNNIAPVNEMVVGQVIDEVIPKPELDEFLSQLQTKIEGLPDMSPEEALAFEQLFSNMSEQQVKDYLAAMFNINFPYKRTTPKIGRNEPCTCGSGIKSKKCNCNK